jgi:hypothetical protein
MPQDGVVEPEKLAILTALVEAYCKENGIDPTSDEREDVARLVMDLYRRGIVNAEELRTELLRPLVRALAKRAVAGSWESGRTVTIP